MKKVFHLESSFASFLTRDASQPNKLLGKEIHQLHKKIIFNSFKVFAKIMRFLTPPAY